MTKFYNENREAGLHLFNINTVEPAFERQWEDLMETYGVEFVAPKHEGNDFTAYAYEMLPYTYVIGTDGKVKWQGGRQNIDGWFKITESELENVEYPFLGLRDIPDVLDKAAKAYTEGKFADALEEAQGIDDEGGKAEALIKKIESRVANKQAQVEQAKKLRRYHDAVRILIELSGKGYKGMPCHEKAEDELKALKKDKDVKAELKAWESLEKVLEANKKLDDAGKRRASLIKFWEKNEGTAAADEARLLAENIGG